MDRCTDGSGRTELLAAFAAGTHLRPDWSAPQLASLARAVVQAAGGRPFADDPVAGSLALRIGPSEHLVLVLFDGLGMNFVDSLPSSSLFHTGRAATMRALFPTSTGVNLTSLYTGMWPAEHGFLGWHVHLPSLGRAVVPYRWSAADDGTGLDALGVLPSDVFPAGRLLDRAPRNVRAIQPAAYCGSVASRSVADDSHMCGAASLGEAVDLVLEHVESARGPTLTYLYWPEPDGVAHRHGTSHPRTIQMLHALDAALARLSEELCRRAPGPARIVVTADHGHLDAPRSARTQLDPGGPLAATLRAPPAGEPRALTFHVRAGCEARFAELAHETLGASHFLLDAHDVDALRLLGPVPVTPEVRARLGDVLAVSRGDAVAEMSRRGEERAMVLRSNHGGFTPAETLVPLLMV